MLKTFTTPKRYLVIALACLTCLLAAPRALAQTDERIQELQTQANALIASGDYVGALPMLEKLVVAEPDGHRNQFYLGFALLAKTTTTTDLAEQKALRIRARAVFIRAKQLGNTEPVLPAMIASIPEDGSFGVYSENPQANQVMLAAETAFARGDIEGALRGYQNALLLDPKNYEAALFSGDMYMRKDDFAKAEVWYQRAIKIDPNRETAYRYSATPLMKQLKYDEARDRYIEAYIVEPYGRFSVAGLTQWANATRTPLAHPTIEIPTTVEYDAAGKINITLDASLLLRGPADGSSSWIIYGATRKRWHDETFAKTYPKETTYRHTLAEEADALRSVVRLATGDPKTKELSPSLKKLKKLDEQGLLEAYILLAIPDRGIAQDHAEYVRAHRDSLRRYVVEYVITGGGK